MSTRPSTWIFADARLRRPVGSELRLADRYLCGILRNHRAWMWARQVCHAFIKPRYDLSFEPSLL